MVKTNQPVAEKPSIYQISRDALRALVQSWGEPRYRADQIWNGIYQNLWQSSHEFTDLSKSFREKLAEHFSFSSISPIQVKQSKDGATIKTLFKLADGRAIEAVWMRYAQRNTLCISSQAGCAMGCVFCATGQMGFQRNLNSGEIIEQVLYYAHQAKEHGDKITNVVIMGMGEPFHNYDATMDALDRLNDPNGFNLGARRITLSTVGIVPGIRRFTREKRAYNLAISLHAADDELRSSLVPINRKYPLNELLPACWEYVEATRRRISFEWALIQDVNDGVDQAIRLASLIKGRLCHVNLIPLNPTRRYPGMASPRQRAHIFQQELERRGIACTIRLRRGIDIQAGCGQLAIEEGHH